MTPKDLPCFNPECPGRMKVTKGSETAKQLTCNVCSTYYYKVGPFICLCDDVPAPNKRTERIADSILGGNK